MLLFAVEIDIIQPANRATTTNMTKKRKRDDQQTPTSLRHNFKFRNYFSSGLTVMFVFFFSQETTYAFSLRGGGSEQYRLS